MGNSHSTVTSKYDITVPPLSPPNLTTIPPLVQSLPHTGCQVRPTHRASALDQGASASAKRSIFGAYDRLLQELGELIAQDVLLLSKLGWESFVRHQRGRGNINTLQAINHPARQLLSLFKRRGAPVKFHTPPWTPNKVSQAIQRGPHRSCNDHIEFLEEEFVDMINKGQWVILPASIATTLPHLRVSPPGVVPQHDRWPRWIGDYTWSDVNTDTLHLAPLDAMQFGHALKQILRELLLANPLHGPVYLNKMDLSDGFYRVDLIPEDIPKLALIFPTRPGEEPLIALPLVLPMGWKNSPPIFCSITETIADVTNDLLRETDHCPEPHHLDTLASTITPSCPDHQVGYASTKIAVEIPLERDPSLPIGADPLQYVWMFL